MENHCIICGAEAEWECPSCHVNFCTVCADANGYVCDQCAVDLYQVDVVREMEPNTDE